MTPAQTREHLKEAVLAYGQAMATGNPLLVKLAGEEAARRIAEAVPDKPTLEDAQK